MPAHDDRQSRAAQLAAAARAGDRGAFDALVDHLQGLIGRLVNDHPRLPDGDSDDLKQVARIALWDAVRSYDSARGLPFATYAAIVIRRALTARRRAARRPSREVLNRAIPLEDAVSILDTTSDPHRIVSGRRDLLRLVEAVDKDLSPLEARALAGQLNDRPMREIADACQTNIKSIDNARTRAHRKLRAALAA
jgi:RNA polymerase sigma factor (sigma-70 family)